MSDAIEQLFREFADQHEAGGTADVAGYLDRAGDDRSRLADMLEAYLVARPRPRVTDAELDAVYAHLDQAALPWPELLPMLREQRGITRSGLVRRLAEALGYPDATSQVEGYLHELEAGSLDPRRVRGPVVAALAAILTVSGDLLERGRRLTTIDPPADRVALAFLREAPLAAPAADVLFDESAGAERPEIDDLFTGGDV